MRHGAAWMQRSAAAMFCSAGAKFWSMLFSSTRIRRLNPAQKAISAEMAGAESVC